ncbi:unnamed protein product [Mytilus coruscus]|uniref:G-protein coupled receptors family 1 profile domain-containing protein n=1 Tax=Mytilus coruscus TaxID=42192 RepID=A0A6J8DU99_MYTCO|nr:unnamed protein product [Mytilus coruscus]
MYFKLDVQNLESIIVKTGLFGIILITNVFVVTIWLSRNIRTPVSVLLSIIAIYDTLAMMSGLVKSISSNIFGNWPHVTGCYIDILSLILAILFHSLSILSTTFLAIQRAVVCAFPFTGPRLCGTKTTTFFVVVSFAAMMTFCIPLVLFRDVQSIIKLSANNVSAMYCSFDNIVWFKDMWKMYSIVRFVTLHLTPAVLITICMAICLLTIHRRQMVSGQSSNRQIKSRTTVMLVLVMFIFVLGELPTTALMYYYSFLPKEPAWIKTSMGVWFCNTTLNISYMMNIWVYIAMSKQFRDQLKEKFTVCTTSSSQGKTGNTNRQIVNAESNIPPE